MTPDEQQAVAALNKRIAEHCACRCDLETGAIVSMCLEHQHIIDTARQNEREACAKVADERAEWARRMYNSNYRAAMAEHIANAIRER